MEQVTINHVHQVFATVFGDHVTPVESDHFSLALLNDAKTAGFEVCVVVQGADEFQQTTIEVFIWFTDTAGNRLCWTDCAKEDQGLLMQELVAECGWGMPQTFLDEDGTVYVALFRKDTVLMQDLHLGELGEGCRVVQTLMKVLYEASRIEDIVGAVACGQTINPTHIPHLLKNSERPQHVS